jgi:hypothetical protein
MSWKRGNGFRASISSVVALVLWASAEPVGAQGNVTVRVDGNGNLIIRGDAADNGVFVKPFDVGEGFVEGLGSTLVNGGDSAAFSGATGDFRFDMRGGDDTIQIDDGDGNETLGDLEIRTGSGDDVILVRHFIVHDDLEIRSGPGNDVITLEQTAGNSPYAEDRTFIGTSTGDDQVFVRGGELPDSLVQFVDEFRVSTGAGRDFVSIQGGLFLDEVNVNLGDGDDLGALGGPTGGVCVCESVFLDEDVLEHVRFSGGDGFDGGVMESVEGLAPPGLVSDFLRVEVDPDDCSFLGGTACGE